MTECIILCNLTKFCAKKVKKRTHILCMHDHPRKKQNDFNNNFDFFIEGFMNRRKEYNEILEKAKFNHDSVKATEKEINAAPLEFPKQQVGKNREFFVWDKQGDFVIRTGSEDENKENIGEESVVYEQLKEQFKIEMQKENQNLINSLNNLYTSKSGLSNKSFTNYKHRMIKDAEYYKIHIDDIINKHDIRKTCMIKNIPNKYTVDMLIDLLNEDHVGEYDFLYLRMDFVNECNVGYAFVNFKSCHSLISFYNKIHGKRWKNFSSHKIAELTYATMQGIEQIRNKFKYSSILSEREQYRPKLFYTKGSMKGKEKPFL
ncbi:hypothetical protein H311_00502 [Anncaliia algerae PRA109]|nr:hypothetical protein H311_00502 [Anncaliia algerae PRA109]